MATRVSILLPAYRAEATLAAALAPTTIMRSQGSGARLTATILVSANASAAIAEQWSRADLFFGNIPGSTGEMSKFCVLLGAPDIGFRRVHIGTGGFDV